MNHELIVCTLIAARKLIIKQCGEQGHGCFYSAEELHAELLRDIDLSILEVVDNAQATQT